MALNIAVLIKQVPDLDAVRIDRASGRPIFSGQLTMSSYDAHAVEEALLLKEAQGGEVTVICAGPASAKDALTRSLAMGADRAVLIEAANVNEVDSLAVARLLAEQLDGKGYDLILAGQAADDTETGHVGPQVAELLDRPLISNLVGLEIEDGRLVGRRDMEDGQQVVEAALPAVVLASTGLNSPRLPSLKGIMAAKKKPFDTVAGTLAPDASRIEWGEPYVPERAAAGIILQDVPPAEAAQQLVAWLREQKVI
jgi:electron transfer flavoprotein beta subunit